MTETQNEQQPHSFKRKLGNTTYQMIATDEGMYIVTSKGTPFQIAHEHCLHCGACAQVCPAQAVGKRQ